MFFNPNARYYSGISKYSKWYFIPLLIIFVGLQIPFLTADPDVKSSNYSSPYTDEGLNSIQIRNFINHGDFTMESSDNLVKTPGFAAFLYVPFKVFGTHLWVGRLSILIACLLLFGMSISKFNALGNRFGLYLIVVILLEFHIFHFLHFCLAEALSTLLIFSSIFILNFAIKSAKPHKWLLLSSFLISFAYYVKIQFLYVIPILPIALFTFALSQQNKKNKHLKRTLYISLYLTLFLLIYIVGWYLPNKDFFEYVMTDQTDGRFVGIKSVLKQIAGLVYYMFLTPELALFFLVFTLSWVIGGIQFLKKAGKDFNFLYLAFSSWILFEAHKLLMTYHPTRYYVSLMFAMGAIISLVMYHIPLNAISKKQKSSRLRWTFATLLLLAGMNVLHYTQALQRRTFEIHKANHYLAQYNLKNALILGARASSLTWESKSIAMPVWSGYFNDQEILEKKPRIIVEDPAETASNHAFEKDGINLAEMADSVRYFGTPNWNVNIYWINPALHR